jgi:hypothetical protein
VSARIRVHLAGPLTAREEELLENVRCRHGIARGLVSLLRLAEGRRGRRAYRDALLAEFARPHLAAELAATFDRVLAEPHPSG